MVDRATWLPCARDPRNVGNCCLVLDTDPQTRNTMYRLGFRFVERYLVFINWGCSFHPNGGLNVWIFEVCPARWLLRASPLSTHVNAKVGEIRRRKVPTAVREDLAPELFRNSSVRTQWMHARCQGMAQRVFSNRSQ